MLYHARWIGTACFLLAAAYVGLASNRTSPNQESPARTEIAVRTNSHRQLRLKRVEDFEVGDRMVGTNPIREQAETVEPDPATWRKISLHMRKHNGLSLWIDLLRPQEWIESTGAEVGKAIHLDLAELGAIGDAEVTKIGPCPPIKPGKGTIVTGKFVHESDGKNVVQLRLEGQQEPTGVTTNHPYWSVDRQEFVPVGQLRQGERIDSEFGSSCVVSNTPRAYSGRLYNFETTEHVYRVGTIGSLVHNNGCSEVATQLLKERPDGAIIRVTALLNPRTGKEVFFKLPGDKGLYVYHDFHLENGMLRDGYFGDTVPAMAIDSWLQEFATANKMTVPEILANFNFLPRLVP